MRKFNRAGSGSQYAYCSAKELAIATRQSVATIYRHLAWLEEQRFLHKINPAKWRMAGKEALHLIIMETHGVNWQFLNIGKRASKLTFRAEVSSNKMTTYSIPEEHTDTFKGFITYIRFLMLAETIRRQSAKAKPRKKSPKTGRNRRSKENSGPLQGKISLKAYGELIGRKSTAAHAAINAIDSLGAARVMSNCIFIKMPHAPGVREGLELAYPGFKFHLVRQGYVGNKCNEYTILSPYSRRRRRLHNTVAPSTM